MSHDYQKYLTEFFPLTLATKHAYSISIHKAIFTEELLDVYIRWEKSAHGKDRDAETLKKFQCNSPIYDPAIDTEIANSDCLLDSL